jgi:hypothetical protein
MLQFKKSFENHKIEIIVYNARTHTAVNYDVHNICLKPGTKCPYESIGWIENEVEYSIDCFVEDGRSKGLIVLMLKKISLERLQRHIFISYHISKLN